MTHFEHLISTPAKPISCHTCQAPIWKLWVDGIDTRLGVDPLDLTGEIQARLDGRRTYHLKRHDRTFMAIARDRYNIEPGDHDTKIILALHKCDLGSMIATGHPNYFRTRYEIEKIERPPF